MLRSLPVEISERLKKIEKTQCDLKNKALAVAQKGWDDGSSNSTLSFEEEKNGLLSDCDNERVGRCVVSEIASKIKWAKGMNTEDTTTLVSQMHKVSEFSFFVLG